MSKDAGIEIQEKGSLDKYELLPPRKLYIAVYKMMGGSYFSTSNESKLDLIKYLQTQTYGYTDIKIYTVNVGE